VKTPEGKEEVMRPRRSVRDEDAHRSPAESEALHGNQQWCHKWSIPAHYFHLFVFGLGGCSYVSITFLHVWWASC